MYIFTVMGTALIKAYNLSKKEPGSLLIVDNSLMGTSLPEDIVITKETDEYRIVDWIHTNTPEIKKIEEKTGKQCSDVETLEKKLGNYLKKNKEDLKAEWIDNTQRMK